MEVIADTWAYLADPASWTGDGGILELLVQQLLLTGTALLLAVLVGLPVALWLGSPAEATSRAARPPRSSSAPPIPSSSTCSASTTTR